MNTEAPKGSACRKCLRCKYFRVRLCKGLIQFWRPHCQLFVKKQTAQQPREILERQGET